MSDKREVRLGEVQRTLFWPLIARARHTERNGPLLRDPKAVEIAESVDFDFASCSARDLGISVLRTTALDAWVRGFLSKHPAGTVVELGSGLNTRFERVDNGRVHWLDLDLPDTIELRREFFTDSERRRMVAASVLDDGWHRLVADLPEPYLFVTEGVLVYLAEDEVTRALAGIARRFPGAFLALDTYSRSGTRRRERMAARLDVPLARWAWACDDPRSLERLGMRLVASATLSRLPRTMREGLPARYRYLLPLADPIMRGFFNLALFQADGER